MAIAGLLLLHIYLDLHRLRGKHLLLCGLPYLLCAAGWAVYVSQDMEAFVSQFAGNAAAGDRFSALEAPWKAVPGEVSRYLTAFGFGPGASMLEHARIAVLIAYIAAFSILIASRRMRREAGSRLVLGLAGSYVVLMTLGEGKKSELYLVYILPFFAIAAGIVVYRIWLQQPARRPLLACAVLGLVAFQAADILYSIRRSNYQTRYLPGVNFVRGYMTESTLVLGPSELAFELGFRKNLVDDFRLGYYSRKRPDLIVLDGNYKEVIRTFEAEDPEVYEYIQRLMDSQYRKVYSDATFDIYASNLPAARSGTDRF
jgi:hypothetical protein